MADRFAELDYKLVSGGTENHLLVLDLRPKGVDGSRVERVLEMAHIAVNKNTVPGEQGSVEACGEERALRRGGGGKPCAKSAILHLGFVLGLTLCRIPSVGLIVSEVSRFWTRP